MRLEREIKEVYEPIHTGGWEVRFNVQQDIENWIREYSNLIHRPYVEVTHYI